MLHYNQFQRGEADHLTDTLSNYMFRPNDTIAACKKGDPASYVVHAFKLPCTVKSKSDKLVKIGEERLLVRCSLHIQMSDFFQGRLFVRDNPSDTITSEIKYIIFYFSWKFVRVSDFNDEQPEPKRMRTDPQTTTEVVFPAIAKFDVEREISKVDEPTDVVLVSKEKTEFRCHSSKLGIHMYNIGIQ